MFRAVLLVGIIVCTAFAASLAASGEKDPKAVVQDFFQLLKAEKYSSMYSYLPAEMQEQTSTDGLKSMLKPLYNYIHLERMEIGRVQRRGDFAVIDTTIYGKISPQIAKSQANSPPEGKIAVQQYLFKENGKWKIATSTSATKAYLMKKHPEFKQGFAFSPPRIFVRQNGQWVSMGS